MRPRHSTPHPFRPLTDREWAWCQECLVLLLPPEGGRGRPARHGLRQRLDAVLEAALSAAPWREARAPLGAPGMAAEAIGRTFRRWTQAGVWKLLLRRLGEEGAPSPALEWFVCVAFRRAWRRHGIAGLTMPRRWGYLSALRAPGFLLWDPDASQAFWRAEIAPRLAPGLDQPAGALRAAARLITTCQRLWGGRSRIPSFCRWA